MQRDSLRGVSAIPGGALNAAPGGRPLSAPVAGPHGSPTPGRGQLPRAGRDRPGAAPCRRRFSPAALLLLLASGALTPAAEKSLEELRAELEAAYSRLETEYRALPRELFEPSAILEKIGREDTALLKWVAEETSWLPYQGLLKGAAGVLSDRAGNSLDRALLLGTLLEAAGYRVQLARATLTDDEGRRLLAGLPRSNPAALAGDCVPGDDTPTRRAAEHAADLEAVLSGLLAEAPARQAEALAAVKDHWWVERGAGQAWVALDPASPGKPLREKAEAQFSLASVASQLAIAAHEVDLTIVIEVWEAGKLIERPVVKATVRPAELRGRTVTLLHHPMSGKNALEDPGNVAQIKKSASAEKEWLPVLIAGDRHIAKASFDDAGTLHDRPNLSPAGKVGAAVGGLFGGLGGGVSGENKEKEQPSSVLTAEWVEIKVRSPGRTERVVRRQVFDLLGPAARAAPASPGKPEVSEDQRIERALTLAGSCEWLILSSHLSLAFVRQMLAKNELGQRQVVLGILKEKDKARRRALANSLTTPGPLYWVATARRALNPERGEIYLDTPNILGFHVRFHVSPEGKLTEEAVIDLASCPVAVSAGQAGLLAAVRQGVVDGAAEDLALQDAPGMLGNTLDVLDAAKAQGIKLVAVHSAENRALGAMNLPQDTRARIELELAAGQILVLPSRPIESGGRLRTAWWRVTPATGETVAVLDTGYHSDTTEEAFLDNDTLCARTAIRPQNPGGSFWRRHPGQIARDMGFNPEDMQVLDLILDFQNGLLQLGVL